MCGRWAAAVAVASRCRAAVAGCNSVWQVGSSSSSSRQVQAGSSRVQQWQVGSSSSRRRQAGCSRGDGLQAMLQSASRGAQSLPPMCNLNVHISFPFFEYRYITGILTSLGAAKAVKKGRSARSASNRFF